MSIADRITSMSNNLSSAYDGIEYLGVDTTGVDKNLQNLSSVLDTVYNEYPKVSDEGISPSIEGSKVGRLKSTLKASDTTQESTTGKNLFDNSQLNKDPTGVYQSTTTVSNNVISITSTASTGVSFCRLLPTLTLKPNTTYACSFDVTGDFRYARIYDVTGNEYYTFTTEIVGSRAKGTFTTTSNTTYRLVIYVVLESSCTISNIQVEEGSTATTYEPYTGGIPSPNPDYPQDIHVVKGNNTVEVCGKNLINPNAGILNLYWDNDTKQFKYNTNFRSVVITAEPNTTYFLSRTEGYDRDFSLATSINFPVANDYATNTRIVWDNTVLTNTITTGPSDNYLIFYFGYGTNESTTREWLSKTQLEYGSSSTYEPYNGTTLPITLPTGMELCKIGDYQDYIYRENGNWYLHKEIVKFKGNEIVTSLTTGYKLFILSSSYSDDTYLCAYNNAIQSTLYRYGLLLCNYFSNEKHYTTQKIANNMQLHTNVGVCVLKTDFPDIDSLNNYFMQNGDNINIYVVATTPTITQITDSTLISQLENLYSAMSKNGQTNILQTNADLPFIISASALKGA